MYEQLYFSYLEMLVSFVQCYMFCTLYICSGVAKGKTQCIIKLVAMCAMDIESPKSLKWVQF